MTSESSKYYGPEFHRELNIWVCVVLVYYRTMGEDASGLQANFFPYKQGLTRVMPLDKLFSNQTNIEYISI